MSALPPPGPVDPHARTERLDVDGVEETTAKSKRPKASGLPRGTAVGRYLLLDLVGEGGMGAVYSAYDPDLGRKVAVKLVKSEGRGPEWSRDRLQREAQAMARLSHPNVLPVYDTGPFQDQVFVAMEFVDGVTLGRWLAEPRSQREVVEMFVAAGEGLAAAHAAGLIHRDFKPDNVLVGADGRARVADFGLAHVGALPEPPAALSSPTSRPTSGSTLAGTVSGTPAYMAPEQFDAAPTDARTDQFSFCVALWDALTGHPPFGDGDFHALRQSVLAGKVAPPLRTLPHALEAALLKGLSLRPEDRFSTMQDLLAELRRDPSRRARRVAAATLGLAALLGLGGVLGWQVLLEQTRCERESAQELARIWPPARRAEIARVLGSAPSAPRVLGEARREPPALGPATARDLRGGEARGRLTARGRRVPDALRHRHRGHRHGAGVAHRERRDRRGAPR
ncbi:MAG: serine/threonine-protein kinase [Myxococcales bacterium]